MGSAAAALALNISSGWAYEEPSDAAPFAIGALSCSDYLVDVAKDPSLQSLYDAWLAGYVKIASQEWPGAPELVAEAEVAGAQAWVTGYCRRREADTILTAAVRFLETKQRGQFGESAPESEATRMADRD